MTILVLFHFVIFLIGNLFLAAIVFFMLRKRVLVIKLCVSLLLVLIWFFAYIYYLFGDVPALRYEFNRLCEEQAGNEVYSKTEEYLDDYIDWTGNIQWNLVYSIVSFSSKSEQLNPHIKKRITSYYYNGQVIAQKKNFTYLGGSFFLGSAGSAESCDGVSKDNIYFEIFKRR
jgi:hypothetical protein